MIEITLYIITDPTAYGTRLYDKVTGECTATLGGKFVNFDGDEENIVLDWRSANYETGLTAWLDSKGYVKKEEVLGGLA